MKPLTSLLRERLQTHAPAPAISFYRNGTLENTSSFADLDHNSDCLAAAFASNGLGKGDRVLFCIDKSLFFVSAFLASLKLGSVAVPCNPDFTPSEKTYLTEDSGPKQILCRKREQEMFQDLAPNAAAGSAEDLWPSKLPSGFSKNAPPLRTELEPDDPALIMYTSGTTGSPKGAVLTQGNLAHDALNVIRIWEISSADRLLHALPLFHVHGLCFALLTSLLSGASICMLDRFQNEDVLSLLASKEEPCTIFMAVPTMYTKLLNSLDQRRASFDHIRLLTSGSAPLNPKEFKRIEQTLGQPPVEREGMSETGMNFSNPLHGHKKPGSIGLPLPDLQVRIVDPDNGKDLPPGQIGEFWLQSPSISPGYWNKPRETAAAFYQGWFKTGDLGTRDEEGYYFLTDRLKHIIISGGENISPKEIENRLNELEDVLESAVFGLPDDALGEKVAAAVVPKPGTALDISTLKAHCREHLHKWKCPKQFFMLDQLPRNTMGKVLKHELQRLGG